MEEKPTVPTVDNTRQGLVVPMPTLPVEVILILSPKVPASIVSKVRMPEFPVEFRILALITANLLLLFQKSMSPVAKSAVTISLPRMWIPPVSPLPASAVETVSATVVPVVMGPVVPMPTLPLLVAKYAEPVEPTFVVLALTKVARPVMFSVLVPVIAPPAKRELEK